MKVRISQDFEVGDILTLLEYISSSERRGFREKTGYPFLGSEFSFLIVKSNLKMQNIISTTIRILENCELQVIVNGSDSLMNGDFR